MPHKEYVRDGIIVASIRIVRCRDRFVVVSYTALTRGPRHNAYACDSGLEAIRIYNKMRSLLNKGAKACQDCKKR